MTRWVLGLAAVVALTGCGTSGGTTDGDPQPSGPNTTTRTTLTDPGLQPPVQRNEGARLDVVYDPCTWIPDEVVSDIGFDPATRERIDLVAERTTLGCTFTAGSGQLLLRSVNTPYEDHVAMYRSRIEQTVEINGREAFVLPDDIEPDTCIVFMKSVVGAVMVARTIFANTTTPCAGIVEFAAKIEATIGAEN